MTRLPFYFLLVLFCPMVILGADKGFLFAGKPIHPRCFGELVEGEGKDRVDLSECKADRAHIKNGPDGMIEFEDMDPADAGIGERHPFSGYRFIGKFGKNYIVQYVWSGGGTGNFSGLAGVRFDGNSLVKVFDVLGGDRCNGGCLSARVENGKILADIRVTPSDLMGLKLGQGEQERLQSCAICCAATATFEVDPGTGAAKLAGVDLGNDLEDDANSPAEVLKDQICFNHLYNEYIRSNRSKLDPKAFDGFVKEFEKRKLKVLPEKKQR